MEYKDYYNTLGVERTSTPDEIKRAYRKLARKYHPDVSKAGDAEARFKALGEAYEVLKDPEKRAAYDRLGANWRSGQDFTPPPDWGAGVGPSGVEFGRGGRFATGAGDASAYSDFFEALFGRGAFHPGHGRRAPHQSRGEDLHATVALDLEDAYRGATRSLTLQAPAADAGRQAAHRTLKVKIPKGVQQGQQIRLSGQGAPGVGGGDAGDLYLEIAFKAHPVYRAEGRDVYLELPVAPWEAALGATVKTPTPAGAVELKVAAESRSGNKLRLKGRGIPGTPPGDFYVVLRIALPPANTEQARALYRGMQRDFAFNPRARLGV